MSGIQIKHKITGEQVGDTIEMGDKTLGELFEELLPRILKKGAVLDWKKLFYEKCEVIVSLQVENKKLKEQSQEELFGLRFDFDEKNKEHTERYVNLMNYKIQLEKENKALKEQVENIMISQQFYTAFLDPKEHAEAVQKEDIDEYCDDLGLGDEKKEMLYASYCFDSDEE